MQALQVQIGQRIRQKRWELGLTQEDLAGKVGVRKQQIQKYESGTNRISAILLYAISRSLDAEISYFFD